MASVVSIPHNRTRKLFAAIATAIALLATASTLQGSAAWAQSSAPANPLPVKPAAPSHEAAAPGPQWNELSAAQQKILQPLAGTWNSLPAEHKGKWIALSQKYPSIAPAEQEKLQSRMAEWAALKPRERERARLNFAETKKLSPTERSADWEAYQALSPEEKQKLAAQVAPRPAGAAVAIKPVAPDKLTVVPLTRRTPEQGGSTNPSKPTLDRHTLLPKAPRPAPSASTPAN